MDAEETRRALHEHVVPVTTTIWREPGVVDLDACAANTTHLLDRGITAFVCAGLVGEHDRFTIEAQKALVAQMGALVGDRETPVCLGTGLGRTVERVRALAPSLADAGVSFAMLMPPPIADPRAQLAYYDHVLTVLDDHGVWPMLYNRPEHPISVDVMRQLFDHHEIPAVKMGTSDLLPSYAALVEEIGYRRCAWLCGVAGWWMPAYYALGMARGMSSGIVNAFPRRPQALLRRILSGEFRRDEEYWAFVRIESLRRSGEGFSSLVLKALQEFVGLRGGMNGDGQTLPPEAKEAARRIVTEAGWLG